MTQGQYSLLGLCMRAGKLATGEDSCLKALRSGMARLALVDASAMVIKTALSLLGIETVEEM